MLVLQQALRVELKGGLAADAGLQRQRAVRDRHLRAACQVQRGAAAQQGLAVLRPRRLALRQVRQQHPRQLRGDTHTVICTPSNLAEGLV